MIKMIRPVLMIDEKATKADFEGNFERIRTGVVIHEIEGIQKR